MIYFDNASTTKPNQTIIELYNKINNEYWYNESSTHKLGVTSKTLVERANQVIMNTLNLKNKKIIYTGSATEANNLAIYGICEKYINQGKHIITSKIEHPSVLECFKDLENKGFNVTYLDADENGIIDLNMLKNSLTKDTILVSIMWVNNIIGSIQPIKKIKQILKDYPRIKFHSDLVQGITKIVPDFDFNDLDLFTFTAHKLHGLKGTAVLVLNDKIDLEKINKGGHQQYNLRGGTMDVAGAVCLAKTLEIENESVNRRFLYIKNIYDYLVCELKKISFIDINSPQVNNSPYVLNFSFKALKGETFMHYMEAYSIYLGYGSACNAKTKALENTLVAVFNDFKRASNAVRISLDENNTIDEAKYFIEKLKEMERK